MGAGSSNEEDNESNSLTDLKYWQKILKEHYTTVCLPYTPLISNGKSHLISEYYIKLELESSKKQFEIANIFEPVKGITPQRMLVEGQPGFGKTTLALKLIYDWSQEENYTKKFDLAFFIPLKQLKKTELTKEIDNFMQKINQDKKFNAAKTIGNEKLNILIIFDGLDELSTDERAPILKILYKQKYRHITVVVTCKTGTFNLQREEQEKLVSNYQKKEFWDKSVEVLGLSEEKSREFFLKTLPEPKVDSLLPMFDKVDENFRKLLASPLFLIMFSYLVLEGNDLVFSPKTELFKKMSNLIVKNYLQKKEETIDDHFDLFNIEENLTNLQVTLRDFGDLAVENLAEKNLFFESNCVNTIMMYNMGFLLKRNNISHFTTETVFEAHHISIIEFAAAFSVFSKFKLTKEESEKRKLLRHYVDLCFRNGKPSLFNPSLFFPFLVGLLQDEAGLLFSEFKSYSFWFEKSDDFFSLLLVELQNGNYSKLIPAISLIIPKCINQTETVYQRLYVSDLYQKVIDYGLITRRLVKLVVGNACDHKLPLSLRASLPEICYLVDPQQKWEVHEWMKGKCRKFELQFNSECSDEVFHPYFHLFTSIQAEKRHLVLRGSGAYTTLEEELTRGTLQSVEIEELECEFTCQEEITCIQRFLKLFPVKCVNFISLSDKLDMNELVKLVTEIRVSDVRFSGK